jgi:hypothetical protein
MLSVEAKPVQVTVTVVAAAPEAIALVPKAWLPVQIVCVSVTLDGIVVPFTLVLLAKAACNLAAATVPEAMLLG